MQFLFYSVWEGFHAGDRGSCASGAFKSGYHRWGHFPIYLFAGIPGTFHQLYFSGTPISIMAIGATFSVLEVVPLAWFVMGLKTGWSYVEGKQTGKKQVSFKASKRPVLEI